MLRFRLHSVAYITNNRSNIYSEIKQMIQCSTKLYHLRVSEYMSSVESVEIEHSQEKQWKCVSNNICW